MSYTYIIFLQTGHILAIGQTETWRTLVEEFNKMEGGCTLGVYQPCCRPLFVTKEFSAKLEDLPPAEIQNG